MSHQASAGQSGKQPERLSIEQRLTEVGYLLAKGLYRSRNQGTFGTDSTISEKKRQKNLAIVPKSSVHKGAGKYPTDGLTDNKEPVLRGCDPHEPA